VMIEVFRQTESDEADWVEAELKEMVLGYQCVIIDEAKAASELGRSVTLPAVRQDGKIFYGRQDLLSFLRDLEQFAVDWRAFQSDACYLDKDGEVC